MDRTIVYFGEIMQDYHILYGEKHSYYGIAKIAEAILGTGSLLSGFDCTATSPAGLTVNVAPGIVYALETVDASTYGSVGTDSNNIVKQGIILTTTNCSCPAPVNPGESINYLIEIAFTETDAGSTILPYYNVSDITDPYSGPGNNNQPQNTVRQDIATITVKPGIAANTGTQTTPNPDSGYVGAWVVTVAYGQSTITSSNITYYEETNFITETLTQKISEATADLRYGQIVSIQNSAYQYAADQSGDANTVIASLNPVLLAYNNGLSVKVLIANTNTGASTLNINSLGAIDIYISGGNAIQPGDLPEGGVANLIYNGTYFELTNPASNIINQYYVDSGTANAYAISYSPALVSYKAGLEVAVLIGHTNTGASTLNISGNGAVAIKRFNGNPIVQNDLYAGMIAKFINNGTYFILQNPAVSNNNILFAQVGLTYNTVVISGYSKVTFDTVVHDPNSWWSAGSYRFIPNIPGLYRISGLINIDVSDQYVQMGAIIFKNGSATYGAGPTTITPFTGQPNIVFATFILELNGSTDYVELFVYANTGVVEPNSGLNYFIIEYMGNYI